jgi:hypothetical protein
MGDVVKFRKPPRNRDQFRGQGGWKPPGRNRRRPGPRLRKLLRFALSIGILLGLAILWWGIDRARAAEAGPCIAGCERG